MTAPSVRCGREIGGNRRKSRSECTLDGVTDAGPGAEQRRIDGFGRLDLGLRQASEWYLWGPYLSERQWGTVREDYSADGDAWNYLPHDHARSRAYRWGEEGLAGWCDIEQRLCLALGAVERPGCDAEGARCSGWERSPRETTARTSRSTGGIGDAVPSHAWNTWRYRYPQRAFPYEQLVEENRGAAGSTPSTSCWTPGSSTRTGTGSSTL